MAGEASPPGHPVKIIKISLESMLSIRDFYDFHRVLDNDYQFTLRRYFRYAFTYLFAYAKASSSPFSASNVRSFSSF